MKFNFERSLIGIAIAIIIPISIGDMFNAFDHVKWLSDNIPSLTLLLLSTLAGIWLVGQDKKQKQLNHIENLLLGSTTDVKTFYNTEEALDYLAHRFTEAQHTIDQAAFSPSLSPASAYYKYDQTLTKALKKKPIRYRHAVLIADQTRLTRVKDFLENPLIQKYYVRYYIAGKHTFPGLGYAIIDNTEVVVRYPYSPEQTELWLSIQQPDIVKLFATYFENLWTSGTRLEVADSRMIDNLEQFLSTYAYVYDKSMLDNQNSVKPNISPD